MLDSPSMDNGSKSISVGLHKTAKANGPAHIVIQHDLQKPMKALVDVRKEIAAKSRGEVLMACDPGDNLLLTSCSGFSVTSSEINRYVTKCIHKLLD